MKYYSVNIPSAVTEWVKEHPFNANSFVFSWHALAARFRGYPEATLPLRKKSRFNGATVYAWRREAARMDGENWTIRMRKSGRDCDYIIVASPLSDGRWCVVSYWPVHHGAPDTDDFTAAEGGKSYKLDHYAAGPRAVHK